ncbi:MAG: SDR family NAD(P)-dependent oxidoreductase [Candidatus Heimdallarchaeota archaeon]|nr:SDR family NAD(P)-dependent oxidoreductase [Candidatus Heimdallarchaeota archaeon]
MKVALVTGGNRGIGLEICSQLANKGFRVYQGTRNDIESDNDTIIPIRLDVTNNGSIRDAVNELQTQQGKLDILINNAGIISRNSYNQLDPEEFEQVIRTNVFGPFSMIYHFIPLLKKSNSPRIINISSGMGQWERLSPDHAAYRLSKTYLNALTKMAAEEFSKISINAVHPGWVRTDMGGQSAPRSVQQGADTPLWLSIMDNPPTGKFFSDREEINW